MTGPWSTEHQHRLRGRTTTRNALLPVDVHRDGEEGREGEDTGGHDKHVLRPEFQDLVDEVPGQAWDLEHVMTAIGMVDSPKDQTFLWTMSEPSAASAVCLCESMR